MRVMKLLHVFNMLSSCQLALIFLVSSAQNFIILVFQNFNNLVF